MNGADQPFAGVRVLLAEDNWPIALFMTSTLEDWGWTVAGTAADPATAEDLAAHADAGCAILDIELEGGTCYQAAEIAVKRGIPVVLTTGHNAPPDLPAALRDVPLLVKPVAPVDLKRALRAVTSELAGRAAP